MSDQLDLFGPKPPAPSKPEFVFNPKSHARRTDPPTSAAAAKDVSYRAGTQLARLLEAYRAAGPAGLTDEQAGRNAGLAGAGFWKRCADLRGDGKIEPTGEQRLASSGSWCMVCRVVT